MYELVNSTKKEFLVWIGDDGHMLSPAYVEALRPAHWSPVDQIEAHVVESGLDMRDALEFHGRYALNTGQMPGWSVRVILIDPGAQG